MLVATRTWASLRDGRPSLYLTPAALRSGRMYALAVRATARVGSDAHVPTL